MLTETVVQNARRSKVIFPVKDDITGQFFLSVQLSNFQETFIYIIVVLFSL